MNNREIAPGIHLIRVPIPDNPLGHLNSYLLKGTESWLMIDAGWYTPDSFASLQSSLKDIGIGLTDIGTIVVTHAHPDHFGLVGRIKQLSRRTRLLMHRWESDLLESRYIRFSELQSQIEAMLERHGVPKSDLPLLGAASMGALQFVTMTRPDGDLYGGEIVSTGVFDLEVIWTPGHSPGHISLYEPKYRLLFSGDHILPTISPNVSYHVQSGDNPLGEYLCALQKLRHLAVTKVLPAHEDVFADLVGRIDGLVKHHSVRQSEIERAVARQPADAYELSSQLHWNAGGWEKLPPLHKRLAVLETVAHLEYMRWQGIVQKTVGGGHVSYSLVPGR